MDALGLEKAAVLGHSRGGAVAATLAARRPDRVDELVLVDSVGFPFRMPWKARLAIRPRLGPFLVLWGGGDRLVPLAVGERIAGAIPNARLEILRGVGHEPTGEVPGAFVDAVQGFFRRGSARP